METELNFNEFPKQDFSEWAKEAELSLKGKPLSSLETGTYEGTKLKPLYIPEDIANFTYLDFSYPGFQFFLRGTEFALYKFNCWLKIANLNRIKPATIKKFLSKNNELCPDGISYNFDINDKNENYKLIETSSDLVNYLGMLDVGKSYFYFVTDFAPMEVFSMIDTFFSEINADPKKLKGGIEFNPVIYWINSGKMQKNTDRVFDEMAELFKKTHEKYNNFSCINIDTAIFHNAGANAIQELAFALSTGNLYISQMLQRGLKIDEIAQKIRLTMASGSQFFGEIAKFRAIRVLWANLIKAYGGNPISQKIFLNVSTALINKSKLDPYVNTLRVSSEAISAILGGCNSLQTGSLDETYAKANDFSFRLALNTQNVLSEECNLMDVIDPAGGSYLIETLTKTYVIEAWNLFKTIVNTGDFIENIKSGNIQDNVEKIYEARYKNIITRKDSLIGTNKYPNLKEDNGLDFNAFDENKIIVSVSSIIKKFENETEFLEIPKLNQRRLSEAFEELRLRSESQKKNSGDYPKVLLACFGSLKQYKPRADFSSEYFAVGGFETIIKQYENVDEAVDSVISSGIFVCVICSSDDLYDTIVEDFSKKLKARNPEKVIILAGNPGEKQERFSSAGVDDYIYLRSNVYEKLNLIMKKMGI